MAGAGSASILVVDDNPQNLRLLADLLGGCGHELRLVTDGPQALQAASRAAPDLVLLDINMPAMDGYEVCGRLKKMPGLADVPVIFLTALTDMTAKMKAFQAGGVDYVTKPFELDEVVARVTTHLSLRKARVDLARNYDQLKQLERLRDDLVNMIVHDMRSPLMVLKSHLGFLKTELTGLTEQQAEDLRAAAASSEVLDRMANDLLDVSRLEAGQMPLQLASYDLVDLAGSVVEELAPVDRSRTIDVSSPAPPVPVRCDGGLIRRVLANMVGNAIKHTPTGGRIDLAISPSPGSARVTIKDQGPGVPIEARTRIFEKFGTVAERESSRFHSVGLGLAFCKLAIEAHGGLIGVDAYAERGSLFWFELPA